MRSKEIDTLARVAERLKLSTPDPETTVRRQVNRFIELGFHKELRQTEDQYRTGFKLTHGAPKPEGYKGRFDTLLVVDPRIDKRIQCTKAGIQIKIDTDKILNTTQFPDRPYAVWTCNPRRYLPLTVYKTIKSFDDYETGSPLIEVISLFLHHPKLFRDRGVDAAGSRYGKDKLIPLFTALDGKPEINAVWADFQMQGRRVGFRGKEIIPLSSLSLGH